MEKRIPVELNMEVRDLYELNLTIMGVSKTLSNKYFIKQTPFPFSFKPKNYNSKMINFLQGKY